MKKLFSHIKSYLQDLRSGEKKLSRDGMLILFFSGILIYVILLPVNNNGSYKNKSSGSKEQEKVEYVKDTFQEDDYKSKLEQELSEFLSEVEGIGKVEVLIYLSSSEEYVVEKDIPSYQTASKETDSQSSEERKEEDTVYTVNDAGNQVPFVTQTRHPPIEGVVIAAEGAGQEEIRIKIIRTVMALYGVDANKIDVLVRKKT